MNTGEVVLSMRKHLGDSQQAFSNRLGVSVGTVSKWETGRFTPDPQMMVRLSKLAEENGLPEAAAAFDNELIGSIGAISLFAVWPAETAVLHAQMQLSCLKRAGLTQEQIDHVDAAVGFLREALTVFEQMDPFRSNPAVSQAEG